MTLGGAGVVEAVLEALDEVDVAVGVELEERVDGLPPGRDRDVEALAAGVVEPLDAQVREAVELPRRRLLLAHEHERHVVAVSQHQLAGVLDDDADAAGELQVVEEEGDLHAWPVAAGASSSSPSAGAAGAAGAAAVAAAVAAASAASATARRVSSSLTAATW